MTQNKKDMQFDQIKSIQAKLSLLEKRETIRKYKRKHSINNDKNVLFSQRHERSN